MFALLLMVVHQLLLLLLLLLLLQLSSSHAHISVTWRCDRRPSCASGDDGSRDSVHGTLHHVLMVIMRVAVGHGRALGFSIGMLLLLLETMACRNGRSGGVAHCNHLLRRRRRRAGRHTSLMQMGLLICQRGRWRRGCCRCCWRRSCSCQSAASSRRCPWGHGPLAPSLSGRVGRRRGDEEDGRSSSPLLFCYVETPECARLTAAERRVVSVCFLEALYALCFVKVAEARSMEQWCPEGSCVSLPVEGKEGFSSTQSGALLSFES